jgi:hypothetical protein
VTVEVSPDGIITVDGNEFGTVRDRGKQLFTATSTHRPNFEGTGSSAQEAADNLVGLVYQNLRR